MQHKAKIKILTLMEVADRLRLSRRTTTVLLETGEIPGRRVGRKWRIIEDDVIAMIRGSYARGSAGSRPAT